MAIGSLYWLRFTYTFLRLSCRILMTRSRYGVTAFRGVDAQSTFLNITNQEVNFQHPLTMGKPKVSSICRDLIRKLLVKDQQKRLGYAAGVGAIKAQTFFRDITWDLLRNQTPPLSPPCAVIGRTGPHVRPLAEVLDELQRDETQRFEVEALKKRLLAEQQRLADAEHRSDSDSGIEAPCTQCLRHGDSLTLRCACGGAGAMIANPAAACLQPQSGQHSLSEQFELPDDVFKKFRFTRPEESALRGEGLPGGAYGSDDWRHSTHGYLPPNMELCHLLRVVITIMIGTLVN
jgi:hypothetical protein